MANWNNFFPEYVEENKDFYYFYTTITGLIERSHIYRSKISTK